MPAALDDDDRLAAGGNARRRHELAGVGDRFRVEQDGAGVGVHRQVVEQVAEIDIGLVAEGDDLGEADATRRGPVRSEEHTSELQSLMRISYAVFCLKKKKNTRT